MNGIAIYAFELARFFPAPPLNLSHRLHCFSDEWMACRLTILARPLNSGPEMLRPRSYYLICLVTALLSPSHVLARSDRVLFELHPEPGITARIVSSDVEVKLRQLLGEDIDLSDPRTPAYRTDRPDPLIRKTDVDFDGHEDLIVTYPDQAKTEEDQIVRYRPDLQSYHVLTGPDAAAEPMQCGMQAIEINVASRELRVHCHVGDTMVTEGLRFDAKGRSWLASRKIESALPALMGHTLDFSQRRTGVFGEIVSWNEAGHEIEARAYSARGEPIEAMVRATRASLYSAPSSEAQTAAYLIAGDKVRVLAQRGDWLRVIYAGRTKRIDRWIEAAAFSSPEHGATSSPATGGGDA